jgi:hypothetical protein
MYNGQPTQAAIKQAYDIATQQAAATGWYIPPNASYPGQGQPNPTGYPINAGSGYFVGGDGRIHVGNPQGSGQPGWGSQYGVPADPSWPVGTQVSDPNQLTRPMSQSNISGATIGQGLGNAVSPGNLSWDYISQQLSAATGGNYNDAAAKAAYQQATGQSAQNFSGSQAANLSADQIAQIYAAGGASTPVGAQGQPATNFWSQQTTPAQQYAQQYQAQMGQMQQQPGQVAGPSAQGYQGFTSGGGYPAGQMYAPAGNQGAQMTLAAQQQYYNQNLQNRQENLAEWNAQQTAAQNYLTMLSNLRGPADWAKYQQVLGATPGGTQDLVRAAAGQYIPGGGATTGVQPQAADLNSLYQQATGGATGDQQALQQMQGSLVAPNQMAPQTWNALQPSQQQMLLGIWESQGYNKDDAQNLFNQSLPKYGASSATSGAFKLQ